MRRPRRNHSAAYKAKRRAALKGDKTLAELADVHPNQITQWKAQLLEHADAVFSTVAERCTGSPTPAVAMRPSGLIPALTPRPPMRSTSIRCHNDWQLNPQIFHLSFIDNCLNE